LSKSNWVSTGDGRFSKRTPDYRGGVDNLRKKDAEP